MLINVDKLKRQPRRIEISESVRHFPVLTDLVKQETLAFNDSINGALTARWAGDIIEVNGCLKTSVTMYCARCLTPVSSSLFVDMKLCYAPAGEEDDHPETEEVELDSDELGVMAFSGSEIDLRGDIEQEIIMTLPQQLLCGESCQGLCPVCGADQNRQKCVCEKPVFHSGLASLKGFKVKQ